MRLFRQALQAGLVWLTAITTLIAGVPHFDCICPNGQQKQFCAGPSGDHCCCGDTCCSSASGCCQVPASLPDQQEKPRCCSESQHLGKADLRADGKQLSSSGCTRTLAQGELAITSAKVNAERSVSVAVFAGAPVWPEQLPTARHFSLEAHQLPPPTDLVVSLQHFLI